MLYDSASMQIIRYALCFFDVSGAKYNKLWRVVDFCVVTLSFLYVSRIVCNKISNVLPLQMNKHFFIPICILLFGLSCQSEKEKTGIATAQSQVPARQIVATIDSTQTLQNIAFGSCNKQDSPQPLWQPILASNPDLWIWLGDNIYGDTHDMAAMQAMYEKQKEHPDYQKLLQQVPVIGIWDDHDYGINDGGRFYSQKEKSRALMLNFLNVSEKNPVRSREGGYQAYTFGPAGKQVKIILLDTRYFRDTLQKSQDGKRRYLPNQEGDILGEAQWQWLTRELSNSQANLYIIGSSIQVIAEEHGYEKWANFPRSRQKLLDLIVRSGAPGVVLLSGDRHIAEISKMQPPGLAYPLYDITSSGLTHTFEDAKENNRYRLGQLITKLNFGTITIDWNKSPLEVTYQVKGEHNQVLTEETIRYTQNR